GYCSQQATPSRFGPAVFHESALSAREDIRTCYPSSFNLILHFNPPVLHSIFYPVSSVHILAGSLPLIDRIPPLFLGISSPKHTSDTMVSATTVLFAALAAVVSAAPSCRPPLTYTLPKVGGSKSITARA